MTSIGDVAHTAQPSTVRTYFLKVVEDTIRENLRKTHPIPDGVFDFNWDGIPVVSYLWNTQEDSLVDLQQDILNLDVPVIIKVESSDLGDVCRLYKLIKNGELKTKIVHSQDAAGNYHTLQGILRQEGVQALLNHIEQRIAFIAPVTFSQEDVAYSKQWLLKELVHP